VGKTSGNTSKNAERTNNLRHPRFPSEPCGNLTLLPVYMNLNSLS
jgi:hypothetical protein